MNMTEPAEADASAIRDLAERIEVLASDLIEGMTPMVVDALAEGWAMGLPSEAGHAALTRSARRGKIVVCCPLGMPHPAAAILDGGIFPGMRMDEVMLAWGEPTKAIEDAADAIWLHALPFAGDPEDDSDGTCYASRQATWLRIDASDDDPPFAPLVAGERMYIETEFSQGTVKRSRVIVLPDVGGTLT